ncbi:hypothetical protein [Streptomyces lacrimifluminis]|nr:hypothetical protein [Streptomyces lacrimifluminis]
MDRHCGLATFLDEAAVRRAGGLVPAQVSTNVSCSYVPEADFHIKLLLQ